MHGFHASTVFLRKLPCTDFEGTGPTQDPGAGGSQIRNHVKFLIDGWLEAKDRESIELIVSHPQERGDHMQGNPQFVGEPNATMTGTSQTPVRHFSGIDNWPSDIVEYDHGGDGIVGIIPNPDHETAHIALDDRTTSIRFPGDTLYLSAGRSHAAGGGRLRGRSGRRRRGRLVRSAEVGA